MPNVFTKDSDSTLDYAVDWSAWLDPDDTITTAEWVIPDGITKTKQQLDDATATVWLSGGTEGQRYQLTCRVTTQAGRVDDRTIEVRCYQR